jgi:immune inhibitor A
MGNDKAQFFRDLFFSTKKIPTGSVNDYYKEASRGAVSFTGEVVGPITLPRKMTDYAGGQSGMGPEPNSRTMARDAINAIKATQNLDAYDINGDKYVDTFVVVHAGGGAEQGADPNKIWSLQWNVVNPVEVGNVKVFAFLTIPEDCSLGLACHELGHLVFSWPDFYDGDNWPDNSEGSGKWDLMGSGSWNGNPGGSRPAHPSAWCKMKQGWVNIINDTENGTIKLTDVKTSGDVHRLWENGDATGAEYFLLENRQQTLYDTDLPGNGLLSK